MFKEICSVSSFSMKIIYIFFVNVKNFSSKYGIILNEIIILIEMIVFGSIINVIRRF